MEINFFLQSKDFGGAEKFAHDLVLEMAKKNVNIYFYTTNDFLLKNLSNKKNIKLEKIPIYLDFAGNRKGLLKSFLLAPLAKFYYLKTLLKIKNRIKKQIIICSGFSEKIIVAPMAKFFNLPIFFIEYGPLDPIFTKFYGFPKLLYYLGKDFVKKVIVPSKNTKHFLSDIFKEKRMSLIPCGATSPKINLENKILPRTISVVSRLEKGKGQDLAIKAFSLVKKEFKNAKLLIIGSGNFEQKLKKLSNGDEQIEFLNYVENKQKIIEQSEIVLCPSVWPLEGFGLTIIEAMALGKPIIAFDRAPGNEMLVDRKSALLAKDGDYIDLAKKIIELLKNKNLQNKLSVNAKKDFENKYQIEKIATEYLNLLQN